MPTEMITSIIPRRGKGPGFVNFASGVSASTFDPAILEKAKLAMNAGAVVEYDVETKPGTGGKTYTNLTRFIIPHDIPPQAQKSLPAPAQDSSLPYLLFDRADDEAVIARLKGQIVKAYVYHFQQGGQDIYGLGVDGAEACKRELAKTGEVIEETDVRIEKDEPHAAFFKAYASRWAVRNNGQRIQLDSAIGTKRQEKFHPTKQPNVFWFEQGCTKAMRNAILRLTPEEIKLRVIELYKQEAKEVKPKDVPQAEKLPANWRADFLAHIERFARILTGEEIIRMCGDYGYESPDAVVKYSDAIAIYKACEQAVNDRAEKK